MSHNSLYNATLSAFKSDIEEAEAMLDLLFNNSVIVEKNINILQEIKEWSKKLAQANAGYDHLTKYNLGKNIYSNSDSFSNHVIDSFPDFAPETNSYENYQFINEEDDKASPDGFDIEDLSSLDDVTEIMNSEEVLDEKINEGS